MAGLFSRIVTVALLVAGLVAGLGGCAHQSALEQGHALVAQQRYRAALAQYQRALALDSDSDEARRLIAQLTPYAVREAEDEAAEAIAAGHYEKAVELARYVLPLDRKRGDAILTETELWMRAALEGLLAERKMDAAYPLAARAKRLFSQMKGLETAFTRLRGHFHDRSDRALGSGDFAGALTALDVIEHNEPDQRAALADKRQLIRGRWADDLVARGQAAETDGHLGVAAVHYARAHEIAGRGTDADRTRQVLLVLEREGRFSLDLRFAGDGARRGLLDRVAAGARSTDGVRVVADDEAATMLATVHADPLRCSQDYTPIGGQKEYVSGTRLVDNPRFLALTSSIARAAAETDALGRDRARLSADAKQRRRDARACVQREEQPAQRRLEEARREQTARQQEVHAQQSRVEALREELARTRAPEARAEKQRELDAAEQELARLRARLAEADQAVALKQAALDQAQDQCRRAAEEASRSETRAAETEAALHSAERELARLERERQTTPAQVSEPIIDIFHYEIRRFTRVCEGPVAVEIEPAWTRGDRRMLSARRATSDDTHAAYPRYGVSADPLQFPLRDEDLVSGAEDDAAAEIVAVLTSFVRDYYASMSDRASEMAASDVHTATDMMVALLVAAPEQLTKAHRERIAGHLRQHYGLVNVSLLR